MFFYDIHTHKINSGDSDGCYYSSILNVCSLEFEGAKKLYQQHFFSCGIHPWHSEDSEMQMTYLAEIVSDSRIVAVGETGLDRLKGPSLDVQTPLFKKHIELSEEAGKPIIIHCVKAWDKLLKVKKETNPTQPWIIHGYRGKPGLTNQLIKEGFFFSVGEFINRDSLQLIPIDSLFCETDKGKMTIREVYLQTSLAVNMELEEFVLKVDENVSRIFPAVKPPKAD